LSEDWTQKGRARQPADITLPKKEPTLKERIISSVDPERRKMINNLSEEELLYAVVRAVDLGLPLKIDVEGGTSKPRSKIRITSEDERAYRDLRALPKLIFGEDEYTAYTRAHGAPEEGEAEQSVWERLGLYLIDRVTENQQIMSAVARFITALTKKVEGAK